jgi:hypothetical protein
VEPTGERAHHPVLVAEVVAQRREIEGDGGRRLAALEGEEPLERVGVLTEASR